MLDQTSCKYMHVPLCFCSLCADIQEVDFTINGKIPEMPSQNAHLLLLYDDTLVCGNVPFPKQHHVKGKAYQRKKGSKTNYNRKVLFLMLNLNNNQTYHSECSPVPRLVATLNFCNILKLWSILQIPLCGAITVT